MDGFKEILLEQYSTPALQLDVDIPSWIIPYDYFILSSIHSWVEVYDWAEGVFALESEPDLNQVFEEVFTGNENMELKINKLIDYVQDHIRYMGIESGIGSIKPFPPEQVIEQRFGDCKDKSLLLVSLLKQIGISEAYPALVSTVFMHETEMLLPGVEIFNHCIVYFVHNDTSYWVDPTYIQQGGSFKDNNTYDYGKALIIGLSADSLHTMDNISENYFFTAIEEYQMESFSEPAQLTITSIRKAREADNRRALLEYYTVSDLGKISIESLNRQYPVVIKTSDIKIDDDIDSNIFITTYYYEVDGFWVDGDKKSENLNGLWFWQYEPVDIYDYLNIFSCNPREYPMGLDYPMSMEFVVIFHMPDKILIADSERDYENEAFYLNEKIEQLDIKTIRISYYLKILDREISPAEYNEVCQQCKEIKKQLPIVFYFTK
jgi:hypothetical protein